MLCGELQAAVLGTQGKTYEIKEQNALTLIEQRLMQLQASGELARQQDYLRKQVIVSIENQSPVKGLKNTTHPRSFEKDLTVVVSKDIRDVNGNLIQKAGTRINPLKKFISKKTLLFFDGTNAEQLRWAMNEYQQSHGLCKMVLVNGPPLALMREHELPFYFDQKGRLVQIFGITQVPAKVFQRKDKLLIEELKL